MKYLILFISFILVSCSNDAYITHLVVRNISINERTDGRTTNDYKYVIELVHNPINHVKYYTNQYYNIGDIIK